MDVIYTNICMLKHKHTVIKLSYWSVPHFRKKVSVLLCNELTHDPNSWLTLIALANQRQASVPPSWYPVQQLQTSTQPSSSLGSASSSSSLVGAAASDICSPSSSRGTVASKSCSNTLTCKQWNRVTGIKLCTITIRIFILIVLVINFKRWS